jgi:hypothetical protein
MTPDRLSRIITSVLLMSAPPVILAIDACGGSVTGNGAGGAGGQPSTTSGPTSSGSTTTGPTATGAGGTATSTSTGSAGWTGSGGWSSAVTTTGWGGEAGWGGTTSTTTGWAGSAGSSSGGSAGWGGSAGSGGSSNDRCAIPGFRTCFTPTDGVIPVDCVAYDAGAPDVDGGTPLDASTCWRVCGQLPFPQYAPTCGLIAVSADRIWIRCTAFCPGVGRRPPGLEEHATGSQLGEYFGGMARLEAASVDAFRILRRELASHRLPRKLDRAMRKAARDEVRHTRAARALGRRFGGTYAPPVVEPRPRRTLEEIAIDNAVEGCVRETYGARSAKDAVVRASMERIARDEIRHAALSWQLDGWLRSRLDRAAREKVARAKEAARLELSATIGRGQTRELAEVAGLPPPEVARAMLDRLAGALDV